MPLPPLHTLVRWCRHQPTVEFTFWTKVHKIDSTNGRLCCNHVFPPSTVWAIQYDTDIPLAAGHCRVCFRRSGPFPPPTRFSPPD